MKTKIVLAVSSLVNAAISFFSFWFMVFATSPTMDDVTMRVGFYVLNLICVTAGLAVMAPWVLAYRNRGRLAAFTAAAPVLLIILAVVAFATLDSWLNRTFAGMGGAATITPSIG